MDDHVVGENANATFIKSVHSGIDVPLWRHALKLPMPDSESIVPLDDSRGRGQVAFFNWTSTTATRIPVFRTAIEGSTVRRWNPRFTAASALPPQETFAQDTGTYPIDQNVLPIHPRGFRTRQESHNGRDIVDRSDTL